MTKEVLQNFDENTKIILKYNKFNKTESEKYLFYQILKNLAKDNHVDLPFIIKKYEKTITNLKNHDLYKKEILKNPEIIDSIYEKIDLEYRRKMGQIFTPAPIADFMTSLSPSSKVSILDPAVGTGVFVNNLIKKNKDVKIHGYDIDPLVLNSTFLKIKINYPDFKKLSLIKNNFLQNPEKETFDFVICNPPYLNFHDFDNHSNVKKIEKQFKIKISKLTNIYSLFFFASSRKLNKDGSMVFITPSEFFYTNYGETLKKFLIENFSIVGFVIFEFSDIAFPGFLTTSVITYLQKKKPKKTHNVNFLKIKEIPKNDSEIKKALISGRTNNSNFEIHSVLQSELDPGQKWLKHFQKHNQDEMMEKLVPLSKICTVNRGIATGYNKFFTFSESKIKEWKIEKKFLKPVISRAQYSKKLIFSKKDFDELKSAGKEVYLLYCFEEPSKNLEKFITFGEKEKVHERYLCAHRKPWYSMERGKAPEILASVFSRDAVRFVLNEAKVLNLTAYHGVYLTFDDEQMIKALLCFLNSNISAEIQTVSRREYGGGLHKFEPGDLEKLLVIDVTKLKKSQIKKLAGLFDELLKKSDDEVLEKIDSAIKEIIL